MSQRNVSIAHILLCRHFHYITYKNERNMMKNVGRINRGPCSEFSCDFFFRPCLYMSKASCRQQNMCQKPCGVRWPLLHCSNPVFDLLRCADKIGTDVTNATQTLETIITSLALKPLMCRIREAFSRVFYQLLFLCAGNVEIFCFCSEKWYTEANNCVTELFKVLYASNIGPL